MTVMINHPDPETHESKASDSSNPVTEAYLRGVLDERNAQRELRSLQEQLAQAHQRELKDLRDQVTQANERKIRELQQQLSQVQIERDCAKREQEQAENAAADVKKQLDALVRANEEEEAKRIVLMLELKEKIEAREKERADEDERLTRFLEDANTQAEGVAEILTSHATELNSQSTELKQILVAQNTELMATKVAGVVALCSTSLNLARWWISRT